MLDTGPRRRVTRAYVLGLASLGSVFSAAVLLAGWGLWSLATGSEPVKERGTPLVVAPLLVLLALGWLFWCMWQLSLALLRGRRTLPWGRVWLAGLGGALIWGLGGTLLHLAGGDAWFSPYPWILALAWGIGAVCVWWVLFRQVFTDRGQPRWPWELDDALSRLIEDEDEEESARQHGPHSRETGPSWEGRNASAAGESPNEVDGADEAFGDDPELGNGSPRA